MIPDLTEDDYDASLAVVREEMPGVTRELFPQILAQLEDRGGIEIQVTDVGVSVRMPNAPQFGVYRVERKRRLH